MMTSPESETLDQLVGGEMPLAVIRQIYPDQSRFERGMLGLLAGGDVRLLEAGAEVPPWRHKGLIAGDLVGLVVSLTGIRRQGASQR